MFSLNIIIFQCDLQITDAATSFPGSLFLTSPGVGERKALGLSSRGKMRAPGNEIVDDVCASSSC